MFPEKFQKEKTPNIGGKNVCPGGIRREETVLLLSPIISTRTVAVQSRFFLIVVCPKCIQFARCTLT